MELLFLGNDFLQYTTSAMMALICLGWATNPSYINRKKTLVTGLVTACVSIITMILKVYLAQKVVENPPNLGPIAVVMILLACGMGFFAPTGLYGTKKNYSNF